ncbi:MAG: helix-turn-helix domain-containing protein [Steroidobacteraceae bacterium]
MSRNVFLDLGFAKDEAVELALCSQLGILIEDLIKARGLTQGKAAQLFGVPQPTISKIVNERLSNLSLAFLLRMLVRAEVSFNLKVGQDPDNVVVTIDEDEGDTPTHYQGVNLGSPSSTNDWVVSTNERSSTTQADFRAAGEG